MTPLLSDFEATKIECIKDLSCHPSSLGYYKGEKMVKQGVLQSPCGKHKSTQAVFVHTSPFSLRCPWFHLPLREELPIFIRPRTWVRGRLATLGPAWEPVLQGFETVVRTRWHQREPALVPVF